MKKSLKSSLILPLTMLVTLGFAACNTGIEGTKAIKMSRSELRETMPGEEERLAAQLTSDPLRMWSVGKEFVVADNKVAVILELPAGVPADPEAAALAGKVLRYSGITARPTPGGERVAVVEFQGDKGTYRFNTSRRPEVARASFTGLDLPMLIDLDFVARADSLLRGRIMWTRSRLWYDAEGNYFDGRKYVPVTITSVEPGTMLFPLSVRFIDGDGRSASMLMNVSGSSGLGAESRTLPSLFSMVDPKLRYPSITAENWQLICDGKVALGMTKDECKLALGNPSDVDAGHNWSSVIDVWSYKDGTFLQFQDGLLVNFRR
jgi:hypothetical protein